MIFPLNFINAALVERVDHEGHRLQNSEQRRPEEAKACQPQ
jgi:hypothetical protein